MYILSNYVKCELITGQTLLDLEHKCIIFVKNRLLIEE